MSGETYEAVVGVDGDGNDITETRPLMQRERVTNVAKTPVFAVTNTFIEFKGRRITEAKWQQLIDLVA